MLIDTHTHLTDPRLDANAIINSMASDGLERLITVGYDYVSSIEGLRIAEQNAHVFCALGIHPSDVLHADPTDIDKIAAILAHEKVVAAGEIGLDYHYDNTDRELQQRFLKAQIEAYSGANVPFVFHLRDAYEDMYRIIRERHHLIKSGAVMHCFSGSLETALSYIDLGFYLSFSGTITYKNAKKFPEIIRSIPRTKILIETDCPYLTPEPKRGNTNKPAFVRHQAEKIAEILDEPVEKIEELTRTNAYNAFKKLR